jgi:hypothetical protein
LHRKHAQDQNHEKTCHRCCKRFSQPIEIHIPLDTWPAPFVPGNGLRENRKPALTKGLIKYPQSRREESHPCLQPPFHPQRPSRL